MSAKTEEKERINGQIVRILLRQRGLRQTEVARRLRVSDATFYHYLSGNFRVDGLTIFALAKLLDASPDLIIIPHREELVLR